MGDCGVNGVATLDCIFPIIANLITWAIGLAGTVALFMIIFAGYQLLFSGGDSKTVDGARKTLTFAIIGLVLVFLSFLIISVIGSFTGVACLGNIAKGTIGFAACQ
jgi:type IV secretory pathway VirB2 component (pilin)